MFFAVFFSLGNMRIWLDDTLFFLAYTSTKLNLPWGRTHIGVSNFDKANGQFHRNELDSRIRKKQFWPKSRKRLSHPNRQRAPRKHVDGVLLVDLSSAMLVELNPDLTGLLDTSGFHRRVSAWIADHPGKKYRLQRYNIDHFRDINGIYGHSVGDQLLRDFGTLMKKSDSRGSYSAHLNGDHFVRFVPEGESRTAEDYGDLILEAFADYNLDLPIAIHMGVYDLCEKDSNSFVMSHKALLALQTIKGDHVHLIVYCKKGMMGEEAEHQEFLGQFDQALREDRFEAYYQPQIDWRSGKIVSAEVLARWNHPSKGLLAPGRFLPALESTGKIARLDETMIVKACKNAVR